MKPARFLQSHILVSLILVSLFIAPPAYGRPVNDIPAEKLSEKNDSSDLHKVEARNGESFFKGVIPASPQAAALARYAEYPVSHTTGVPDITIPLYEIDLGGFTLPISVSYHASGCRVDEVPTCVGLGWSLNAGGAVVRSILGGPDWLVDSESTADYSLRDYDYIYNLVHAANVEEGKVLPLLLKDPEHDTESDRYSLNAGGHSLVFRYSHSDREFVVLNHESCIIQFRKINNNDSYFYVAFPDGTQWTFSAAERTGVDHRGEGMAPVTAWYVKEIVTPWGTIDFTYRDGERIDYSRYSYSVTAGPDAVSVQSDALPEIRNTVDVSEPTYTYSYGQTLVETISWNGNKVHFDYSFPYPGKTTDRLVRMRVVSSAGETLKSVEFGNDTYWASSTTLSYDHGRRMLMSLDDSMLGKYSFEYDTRIKLPPLDHLNPDYWSDLYGFFRGSASSSAVTQNVADRLQEVYAGYTDNPRIITANRTPVESGAKNGLLKKITYPTGGSTSLEYESNKTSRVMGGVRIKSMTINDGTASATTSFAYTGIDTQEAPEDLMWCDTYLAISGISAGIPMYKRRRGFSSPSFSPFQQSNCVAYISVTETRPDGSRVTYDYDSSELVELFGVEENLHPTLFRGSVLDLGSRLPLLVSRIVTDNNNQTLLKENFVYDRKERFREFDTGVRIAAEYGIYDFFGSSGLGAFGPQALWDGPLQFRKTTARVRAATLTSRTVKDCRSGMTTTTSFTYDASLRTTRPKTETMTGSDGRVTVTEYTYPFEVNTAMGRGMTEFGLTDAVVAVNVKAGQNVSSAAIVSSSKTDYALYNDNYYPVATSSWSVPTGDYYSGLPQVSLQERERVSSYNSLGRPLSIRLNDTDQTSFTWDSATGLLLSVTSPGSLTTTYTHKPLFGIASISATNGHLTAYAYNPIGLLKQISDHLGVIESYEYSISGHKVSGFNSNGNSVTVKHYLSANPSLFNSSRQYSDGLGRPSVNLDNSAGTSRKYLYSAVTYDNRGREERRIMPAVGTTLMENKSAAQVLSLLQSTYSDPYAYSNYTYDALDRPLKTSTPGQAWHNAGKAKVTEYIGNAANSVRLYSAPMDAISLAENGFYAASTLIGERTVDEDGNEMTVYSDRHGRKVLERRGTESGKGQNDTYFVYNDLGQLRYVLSPGYELSGYKDKFAYEYRYDRNGNVVKKFIPGGGYTQYWYDRSGRMAFMQDENLRSRNLHRFFLYDRAGRQVLQGTAVVCDRAEAVNFADYTGGASGFMQTGYTLQDASRIAQATMERVDYYDNYTFAGSLDSRLAQSASVSAKGFATGSVIYNSEGGKSMSAIYYDLRGNVTTLREITDFGTLRVTENTYTFTNRTLTSKMTASGGLTMLTENSYDNGSGLLSHTDVTVNGSKQRVASLTYDDLGRVKSITRGNSGGTVSYGYNLHGQTVSISGPGFSQSLHYADGPGTALYNGSVSAMSWTMGYDATQRGYKYSYNKYNWLTLAEYGEGSSLSSNRDRYTERFSDFMLNGGIRRLQRHGLKADGKYGKIDNLHVYYNGNRITSVLEDAADVTQPGSMDYPGKRYEMEFGYNAWGALTRDDSRGIASVEYDCFGNPVKINYSNGSYTKNVYSATGVKLKSEHSQNSAIALARVFPDYMLSAVDGDTPALAMLGVERMEYRGPVIYRNGAVYMVLFAGGYATISGGAVTFHYYTQDYLGNNRAVVNGSTGAIEQTTAYYPYGGVIADLGSGNTGQPFKFGGKELVTANGLNEYDFGARRYYQAIPHFTSIDPLCEKYYWLSPYLYCANNPVNLVDRDGNFFETLWDIGNVLYDVGAAIANHIQGDHATAVSLWTDAAFDTAAAFIPLVPAGASKIGKAAKAINVSDVQKTIKGAEKTASSQESKILIRNGRSGRQARLKELGNDPKLGKADKGWIKQEQNQIKHGKRSNIRNPKGKVLAHPRGKEAAKGFSYKESQLQLESNHQLQHKHDNNGKKYKIKEIED